MQRYDARLENLRDKDNWEEMCSTTPADFAWHHFDHPDSCEDRVGLPFHPSSPFTNT